MISEKKIVEVVARMVACDLWGVTVVSAKTQVVEQERSIDKV